MEKGFIIECDVHLLADGKAIVFHDENMERMTGLKTAIFEQDAKSVKDIKLLNSDHNIPLLEEVLQFIQGQGQLLIEIKNKRRWFKIRCYINKSTF